MEAVVTKPFDGRPDDEALSRRIEEGEVIRGDLAAYALENNLAKSLEKKPAARKASTGKAAK